MLDQIKREVLNLRKNKSSLAPFGSWLVSEIENIGKNKGNRATTEDETIQALKKMRDSLSVEEEQEFVSRFIPEMESDDDVLRFFRTNNYTTLKDAMPALKREFGAKVDMRRAKQLFENNTC